MNHQLPSLSYSYNALEPFIDEKTMETHHQKHHQGYVDKLNTALESHPDLQEKELEDIIRDIENVPEDIRTAVQNNGGGHLNHSLFWQIMGPEKEIDEQLVEEIKGTFGSTEEFKKIFSDTAVKRFGSGWAWLVRNQDNKLEVYSLPNQDSPYTKNHTPLIGLDVWEHAYYLKYQNRRPEYIEQWWNVLKLL